MTELRTVLSRLPEPEPPPELAAAVLARIARLETNDIGPPLAARSMRPASFSAVEGPTWTTVGALAVSLVFVVSLPVRDVARSAIGSIGLGAISADLIALSDVPILGLVWAAALVLYVLGLFAPLGHERSS